MMEDGGGLGKGADICLFVLLIDLETFLETFLLVFLKSFEVPVVGSPHPSNVK